LNLPLGIAHGDVKPENILIFANSDGSLSAKLTDFGYSVFRQDSGSGLKLARSEPWNDPLYYGEAITFEMAVKIEAYSFGMVCLWAILHKHLTDTQLRVWTAPRGPIFITDTKDIRDVLIELKSSDELEHVAQQLLETCRGLNQEEKTDLTILFGLTLSLDLELRAPTFNSIVRLLPNSQ
jgi:hypothetical protein